MLIRLCQPAIFWMSNFLLDKAMVVGSEAEAIRDDKASRVEQLARSGWQGEAVRGDQAVGSQESQTEVRHPPRGPQLERVQTGLRKLPLPMHKFHALSPY